MLEKRANFWRSPDAKTRLNRSQSGLDLINESQEEIRLELVAQTNHDTKNGRILISLLGVGKVQAVLVIGHNTVHIRCLLYTSDAADE